MFKFLSIFKDVKDAKLTLSFLTTLTCGLKRRVVLIEMRMRQDRNVKNMYLWDSQRREYIPKIKGL